VAHEGLDVGEREDLDGEGAEGVPEVVKADRLGPLAQVAEPDGGERVIEPSPQRDVIEVVPGR
jgi:hypothetical protein